jgi:hypothetical protein
LTKSGVFIFSRKQEFPFAPNVCVTRLSLFISRRIGTAINANHAGGNIVPLHENLGENYRDNQGEVF